LGVLKRGYVLVGNVPSTNGLGTCTEVDGQETGVEQGSLLILDGRGHLVTTLSSKRFLNGPWDLTLKDDGTLAQVFVSNALSGTVVRLDLMIRDDDDRDANRVVVTKATQIGSGYVHRCDPAAFVVGPTGLALDEENDTLYVASTGDNAIFAIRHASETANDSGTGNLVVSDSIHMHGPLGLARARNGNLITSQGDAVNPDSTQPSEIVEYTPTGRFVAQFPIDPSSGSAFGLALTSFEDRFRFAAVDDGLNVLDVWVVP
jgi:DNA-binding beta-propeller fold protein YncE